MMKFYEHLTDEEQNLLLKAPVLVSVLACSRSNSINKAQKADAIKLAHFKTFTADPILLPYYNKVDKSFRDDFDAIVKQYSPLDEEKRMELKEEVKKVHRIIGKLEHTYGNTLLKSLEKYSSHVNKAQHSVIEDFIFPIPIPGLSS
jgi:hypothetical protein